MNANNIFFQKSITNSELGGLKSNWQIEAMDAANSDNSLKKFIFLHNKGERIELTHFHKTSEDILFKQQ